VTIPARRGRGARASVAEDRQVELAEARGVGEHVDFDELPARDRKTMTENRRPRATTTTPTAPFTSAGCTNRPSREKVRACSATARAPRTSLGAPAGTAPRSEHDVCVDATSAKSPSRAAAEKASTTSRWRVEVGVGNPGRSLHPAACAARELPRGGRGALHDRCHLVEGHGEHVVQHEREPLGGGQRVEDDEQRQPDRVGQQRFRDNRPAAAVREPRYGTPAIGPPTHIAFGRAHAAVADDRRRPLEPDPCGTTRVLLLRSCGPRVASTATGSPGAR